jgi:Uma2 family endonuclease
MELTHSPISEVVTYKTEYELERGKPMPSKNHGRLQAFLSRALLNKYLDKYDIESEVSLELVTGPTTPDIIISEHSDIDWLNDEIKVTRVPITTIEILSPTQGLDELKNKAIDKYFPAGVKSAWIIVPTFQTIYVLTPDKKVATFTEGVVKDKATGLEINMSDIFIKNA